MIFWVLWMILAVVFILFFTWPSVFWHPIYQERRNEHGRMVRVLHHHKREWAEGWFNAWPVLVCGGIVMTIYTLATGFIGAVPTEQTRETYPLSVLRVTEDQDGVYLISSWAGEHEPAFTYLYSETDEHPMQLSHADADDAEVTFDGGDDPRVDMVGYQWGNPVWVPWPTGHDWFGEFHVPKDSILQAQTTPVWSADE